MNVNDFYNEVFNDLRVEDKEGKKFVKQVINSTFKKVIDTVAKGESLKIKDFGTFKLKILKARKMTVPFTKEEKLIPERKKMKFLPSNKMEL